MRQFEVGKEYTHGWAGDADFFTTWKVLKRTAQTVTITNGHETKTCRINKRLSEMEGCEAFFPFGQYSMAPVLRA